MFVSRWQDEAREKPGKTGTRLDGDWEADVMAGCPGSRGIGKSLSRVDKDILAANFCLPSLFSQQPPACSPSPCNAPPKILSPSPFPTESPHNLFVRWSTRLDDLQLPPFTLLMPLVWICPCKTLPLMSPPARTSPLLKLTIHTELEFAIIPL